MHVLLAIVRRSPATAFLAVYVVLWTCGSGTVATGLSVAAMRANRTMHPPDTTGPFVVVNGGLG